MLKRRSKPMEKKEFDKLTNGEYEGRLTYVADLGLQTREYKGDIKEPCQQISLGLEILGNPVTIDGQEVPRILWTNPFNIFFNLSALGNEFKYYRVFDSSAQEGDIADWDSVLGTPCTVVVDKTISGDNQYDHIAALTPIPSKYRSDVAEGQLSPSVGDADESTNPAQQAMFGLTKYVFDKRIVDVPF